jgi:hypothetical protein
MTIASILRIAAVVSAVAASGAAHAVYRCGNVFQDTPCDAAGTQMNPGGARAAPPPARGTLPAPAGAPAAAPAGASPFLPGCSRIGQEAQKMVWKREGGATQDHQRAELPAGNREEMEAVLDSVYRKRGSAPEIRSAIEAECIAQKQEAADKAALLRSLLPANAGTQAGTTPAAPSAPGVAPAGTGDAPPAAKAQAANGPSPACAGWRRDLDSLNGQLRAGGNAATMERIQAQRRSVEKSMSEGRC